MCVVSLLKQCVVERVLPIEWGEGCALKARLKEMRGRRGLVTTEVFISNPGFIPVEKNSQLL
jgi:hypothetical protein